MRRPAITVVEPPVKLRSPRSCCGFEPLLELFTEATLEMRLLSGRCARIFIVFSNLERKSAAYPSTPSAVVTFGVGSIRTEHASADPGSGSEGLDGLRRPLMSSTRMTKFLPFFFALTISWTILIISSSRPLSIAKASGWIWNLLFVAYDSALESSLCKANSGRAPVDSEGMLN